MASTTMPARCARNCRTSAFSRRSTRPCGRCAPLRPMRKAPSPNGHSKSEFPGAAVLDTLPQYLCLYNDCTRGSNMKFLIGLFATVFLWTAAEGARADAVMLKGKVSSGYGSHESALG